ncbi:RnfABCDGE type electron transport complex subunit D [Acholeplasma equirhinis]|uniref:RnfABCDGE type electron transport complex subunit D n=1 Tax=Acholeplasma equirhinis TaxID=555393 RepID=UPI00197AB05A|nr:RnfABCDGE type electron transport complex subunit D [Acholeplasma equirhinis]MBN3491089.1 RnfABCDGE type electron transport complex subunit D [Acholeplasma equirhinis]
MYQQNMTFSKQTSPYIRKATSTKRMMFDVLIALTPVTFFSIYRFGLDALTRILLSLIVFVLVEMIYFLAVTKVEGFDFKDKLVNKFKKYSINNFAAPAVSGLIYAMLLPDQIDFYVVIIGALFGAFVGKMIFGGLGFNLFNPAALGRIFIAITFTGFFTGSYGLVDAAAGATPLSTSFPQVFNSYSLLDLFSGNIPGSLGEVNSLAILIGALYLFIRKSADFRPALSALLIFTALSFVAGLVLYPQYLAQYVLYQVLSGGLLFGLAFMITDPATSPITRPGRWIFGLIIGTVVFSIRQFGNLPEGVAFAILLGNMLVPVLDYPVWAKNPIKLKFILGYSVAFIAILIVSFLVLGGYAI